MNNTKKYLIIAVGILFLLIALIWLLQSLASPFKPSSSSSPFPTSYSVNQYRKGLPSQNTFSSSSNSSIGSLLSQDANAQLNRLRAKLPIETDDFVIKYSPNLDKIVITRKSPLADPAFGVWAQKNGFSLLTDNPQTTIISNKSMEEVQTPYVTKTPEEQIGNLISLFNFFLAPPVNISQISPTVTPTETANISSQSISSSPAASLISKNSYVYYSQCDGPYDRYPLTSSCDLCEAGCGPTTVAMILASYNDKKYTPPEVVEMYKDLGSNICGTKMTDAKSILSNTGIKTSDYILPYTGIKYLAEDVVDDFRSYLENGWTLFTLANYKCDKDKENGCYHYFWVTNIDDQGNIMAYDPFYGKGAKTAINENIRYPFPKYVAAFGVKK